MRWSNASWAQTSPGVLGCDCFLAYDALKTYTQSKCAGHLLRRCAEIMESKSGRAVRFSQQVARLLRAAITLKQRHLDGQDQRARLRRGVWSLGSRLGSVAGRALHRPGQRPLRQTLAQTTPASVDLPLRGRHGRRPTMPPNARFGPPSSFAKPTAVIAARPAPDPFDSDQHHSHVPETRPRLCQCRETRLASTHAPGVRPCGRGDAVNK